MNKTWLDALQAALDKAKEESNTARYLEECGSNPGIRKINANKYNWLTYIIYLAELGFECEKRLSEAAMAKVEVADDENVSDFRKALELFRGINS